MLSIANQCTDLVRPRNLLGYHLRILNADDDPDWPATGLSGLNLEDALEALRRIHQGAMLAAFTCGGDFACDKLAVMITTETKTEMI